MEGSSTTFFAIMQHSCLQYKDANTKRSVKKNSNLFKVLLSPFPNVNEKMFNFSI